MTETCEHPAEAVDILESDRSGRTAMYAVCTDCGAKIGGARER